MTDVDTWEMSGHGDARETPESPAAEQRMYQAEGLQAALTELRTLVASREPTGSPVEGEFEQYADALTYVGEHAEQAQLFGLSDIALRLAEQAVTINVPEDAGEIRLLLGRFVDAASAYATDPTARSGQEGLVACLAANAWGPSPSSDEMDIVRLMLGMSLEDPAPLSPSQPLSETESETEDDAGAPVFDLGPVQGQPVDAAVLAMFREESREVLASFADFLVLARDETSDDSRSALLEAARGEMESLSRGAEYSGLTLLTRLLERLHQTLEGLVTVTECAPVCELLQEFPAALMSYLEQPTNVDAAASLALLLQHPSWKEQALTDEDATDLILGLTSLEINTTEVDTESRPREARIEDVTLELPEDINPELLDGLLMELPVQSSAFARAVQSIIDGHGTREDIDVAKRAAHTLKGAANTVGIRGLANLTHYLEDILVALSEHGVLPNLGLSQTLGYAADCLEGMSEALSGIGTPPSDAVDVLQDVLNWANRIDADGIEVARGEAPMEVEHEAHGVQAPVPADRDQPKPMLRVPAHVIDELLRVVGETITSTAQIQNRIALTMQQARTISQQNVLLQRLVGDLETMVDLRGLNAAGQIALAGTATEFDTLEFEQYNELQTLSRQLVEAVTDSREMGLVAEEHIAALDELLEQQGRLHLENQRAVLTTRMVPVGSVFSRLQRGVRQACRILDKDVELHLHGGDIAIDGNILHELVDALMHVLRNSVDHGIESPEERSAAGKPASGNINLSFQREGDYITVRCEDDGRGLDLAAIRAQAERRGLIAPDAQLSEEELSRLILIPGFSTREGTTQVSGRGIGMDAVNAQVTDFKGLLTLISRPGLGLTLELRLPVTLLSTHALLVSTGNKVIAISTRGLVDIHYVNASIEQLGAELAKLTEDKQLEVIELEAVLDLPADHRRSVRHGWPVLLVRTESGAERAVVVQEVVESRSIVVKTLGPYVPKMKGIVGATILGDGNVAPVIDLPELLHSPSHVSLEPSGDELDMEDSILMRRRRALVVDDSISARRAVAQVLRDADYEVSTAVDGLDAVNVLEQWQPDIVVTDMEMPRLNGFEFTQHLRAREGTRELPVIMVTSRSTEKHRRQAELVGVNVYLTKPFNERELIKVVESLITGPA